MGAFENYQESPSEDGARELGRLATFIIPPNLGTPPPPAEIRPEHRAAFVDGFTRERMSRAAGLSPSWYGPPIEEPRA